MEHLAAGNPFLEVAAILAVAAVVGGAGVLLRQPLIVAFLAAGILAGPSGLGLVGSPEFIASLGSLGIALLLFLVGLRLDPRELKHLGPVAVATGGGQVLFTSVIGYLIALALGFSPVVALYIAVALTFSSTIIIVKLLADKRELDTLHGRVAVGFLIVQDLFVILVLAVLSLFAGTTGPSMVDIGLLAGKGAAFLLAVYLAVRFLLGPILHRLARSKELLVLVAVAWAIGLAAGGDLLGFSKELGAFIAGVALATTPFRDAIGSRLVTLRDFLLLFFFVDLGSELDLGLLGEQVPAAMLLSAFVLIGNPLIVMAIMGTMGYRRRTGFLAGLTVAQISEFSLVLMAMGLALGHVGADAVGLVTLVGLVTIASSTYLILYSYPLFDRIGRFLGVFERARPWREEGKEEEPEQYDAIVFGLGRYGMALARCLRSRGWRVLCFDVDPAAVSQARKMGLTTRFGDADDPEFPAELPLKDAKWVICTVPEVRTARTLLEAVVHHGHQGRRAVVAHTPSQAEILKDAGADRIVMPFEESASRTAKQMVEPDASIEDDRY